jgi:hypothetical protein
MFVNIGKLRECGVAEEKGKSRLGAKLATNLASEGKVDSNWDNNGREA